MAAPARDVIAALTTSPSDPGQEAGDTASLEKAGAAATDAVQGSTILSVQAENDGKIWEIQLAGPDGTEHVLEVDAAGKAISEPRVKDTGSSEKARVVGLVKAAKQTFKDAVEKVSAAVPQGEITHISLDRYNDNALVWDADVMGPGETWHGVKVNAEDGTVTKTGG
ncbi:PepSY domain-containing protein [Nonomuraea sediminis]|uniref:PepSY domain-containing protein n=1 Tax=Nonomuraea sediminis TaxID=2835864 RepID=UPI001BDCA3C8|nr:PepSY domain-containing protein [Nonomuraea sediminis]